MMQRDGLTKDEAATRLPLVIALVAAWTNGKREEATEDTCDLAIMTVAAIEESLISGTPCTAVLPNVDLSFAASAERNGLTLVKLPPPEERCGT
jgi:hypothetical protein